ncbi:MAG: hypothetical protein EHM61_09520 [Acidobacteria bacterium]|nr:MAG: hypothetical protein EHM61_09520 [Acidobacteriota bacterium]
MKSTQIPRPWYQSPAGVLAATLLLPPVGLVLLWLRPGTGVFKKVLGSFATFILVGVYLYAFGVRLIPDGSGIPKILTVHRPDAQAEAIERHRAEQRAHAVSPPVEVNEAAEPTRSGTDAAAPAATAAPSGSTYWTDFRGPNRDGRYDQAAIRTPWPKEGLPLAWKQPCGGGYASFSIANGRAFTIEQRRDREVVAAYDLKSGRELWTDSWAAFFEESMGGDGPRATPTWHEGKIYALGATGVFRCLDGATGKVVWSTNILEDAGAENLSWGMAASPLVIDEKVIVLPGGSRNNSVAACDKRNGQIIWTALNDKQAYVSPIQATLAGKRQLIVVSSSRVVGLTVEDGSLLWEYPWKTQYDINASQPIVLDESRFVISSGYGHGTALVEIKAEGEKFSARTVWENNGLKSRFNGFVLHEGHIYGSDEGILVCLEAATGTRKWKGGRYGYGQLILAGGHLIITTEDGDVVLVRATPEKHEEVSRFSALSGRTWNNPAIADGYLLVRNDREMAAYRIVF